MGLGKAQRGEGGGGRRERREREREGGRKEDRKMEWVRAPSRELKKGNWIRKATA